MPIQTWSVPKVSENEIIKLKGAIRNLKRNDHFAITIEDLIIFKDKINEEVSELDDLKFIVQNLSRILEISGKIIKEPSDEIEEEYWESQI